MKSALALVFVSTFAFAFASHGIVHKHRCSSSETTHNSTQNTYGTGGWVQKASSTASFTQYSGCGAACKLCFYFHGLVLHRVHTDRGVLSQRAA